MERSISWTSDRRSFIAAFAVVHESAAQEHLPSAFRIRCSTRDRKSSHSARSYGGLTKRPIEDPQVSLADSARDTHGLSGGEVFVVGVGCSSLNHGSPFFQMTMTIAATMTSLISVRVCIRV